MGKTGSVLVLTVFSLFAPAVQAADIDGSFFHNGVLRRYTLHVPPSYNQEDSLPLVVALHGGNGNPAQFASFTAMSQKADAEDFFVVYPEGTILPAGYTGWNAGDWTLSTVDDLGFISALIDTVISGYVVDTLMVYAMGWSIGGMMVHTLACESSDRIAAFAPVEGGLTLADWDQCEPARLLSIMHIHARNDPTVPYYGNPLEQWYPPIDSVMEFWAGRLGCANGPDSFTNPEGALKQTWTREDDSCEVVFWTTEDDNGHQWPGSVTGSQQLAATDEIWDFFLSHPIPEPDDPEPGVSEFPITTPQPVQMHYVCRDEVTLQFHLLLKQPVTIELFDASGRKVLTVLNDVMQEGVHSLSVDAGELNSGAYFCRVQTPTLTNTYFIQLIE